MALLSIVVPCYNEEDTIHTFYKTIRSLEPKIKAELEFCFIDDGSKDKTLSILRELHKHDSRVHYSSFSRNFGKEAGLFAGLEMSRGDYVVVMDVDLQDPPALLPEMLEILEMGNAYDCVATKRSNRVGEPKLRSFFSKSFYRIMNHLSSTEIEYNRFSKGIFSWVGFRTEWIAFDNVERSAGTTKWSFWSLFKYAIDGLLAYSIKPLYIVSVSGIVMCLLAVIFLLIIVFRALLWGDPVAGWPSLASIIIFLGGLILLGEGITGLYISKIYLETKNRKIYITKEQA